MPKPALRPRGGGRSGEVETQCSAVYLGTHCRIGNPALVAGTDGRIANALLVADERGIAAPQQAITADLSHQLGGHRGGEAFENATVFVAPGGGAREAETAGHLDPGAPALDRRQHSLEAVAVERVGRIGVAEVVDHHVDAAFEQSVEHRAELLPFDRDVDVPAKIAHPAE